MQPLGGCLPACKLREGAQRACPTTKYPPDRLIPHGCCALAPGQVSYPTGPTWLLYDGDDAHCAESIPLLLARSTFCDAFVAHARVFRTYQSWVLTMMLRQVPVLATELAFSLAKIGMRRLLARHRWHACLWCGAACNCRSLDTRLMTRLGMHGCALCARVGTCAMSYGRAFVYPLKSKPACACTCLQAGLRTHAFPRVMFRAESLAAGGQGCNPDKAPAERHISFRSASNTFSDPEEARRHAAVAVHPSKLALHHGRHPGKPYGTSVHVVAGNQASGLHVFGGGWSS